MKNILIFVVSVFSAWSCTNSDCKWPGGKIPFVLIGFEESETQNILNSLMMWSVSGVKFVLCKKENKEKGNILVIVKGGGAEIMGLAATAQGSQKKDSVILLRDTEMRTICHEVGHVLGLQHENQRPDAALYTTIRFDVLNARFGNNLFLLMQFLPLPDDKFEYDWKSFPYDYSSVMHCTEFIDAPQQIGNTQPSPWDLLKVRSIYVDEI